MPPLVLTREIWALAWPAILRNAAGCAADRLTLAFVGHYDASTVHYDGAGLGKMFSKKRTEKEEVIRLTSCIQGPQVDWNEIIDNCIIFHFPMSIFLVNIMN